MTTHHLDAGWLSQITTGLKSYLDHPEWLTSPTSSVTGGGAIQAAEDRFADLIGVRFAVLLPSATYAMRAALQAAGVGPGDDVIIPELDWPANWAAIESLNANPVPVAVSETTLTISPEAVQRAATIKTKAVIATHAHGVPADVPGIAELVDVPVLEDLTGALGATLHGRPVGSLGDAGVLSLGPGKELDSGEGAVLFTDDATLWEHVIALTAHPVRQTLSGLNHPRFGAFSVRPHPLTAVLALVGLSQWNPAERRAESRLVADTLRKAGISPLVGGPERELTTTWLPVHQQGRHPPDGFLMRSSGARLLRPGSGFAPVNHIHLLTPA